MSRNSLPRVVRCIPVLALALIALPAHSALVINEVDYDQPGTDGAEFIELYNSGPGSVDMTGYSVILINGSGGGAVSYQTIALPAVSLGPGGYYVICGNAVTAVNCNLDVNPNVDLIQNGSPDAIGLRDASTVLIDAVSYEGNSGAPYTEGTGAAASDDNATSSLGLSRFPNGADTNNNNADWSLRCITPGRANGGLPPCDLPVPTRASTWGSVKTIYR